MYLEASVKKIIMSMALLVMASGCAGIEPGKTYSTETFAVPIGYQEAYRRAEAQTRDCAPPITLTTNSQIYTDNQRAVLRISTPNIPNGDMVRINISAKSANESTVVVTVADKGIFDKKQINAVRQSIETGKSVCRK